MWRSDDQILWAIARNQGRGVSRPCGGRLSRRYECEEQVSTHHRTLSLDAFVGAE
jgi:hypothetical protein